MGQDFTYAGALGNFTVVKSNPTGTVVRFTVTDTGFLLTTSKMIRSVIEDAIDQFIATNRAQMNTNGDSNIKGSLDYDPRHVGDGFIAVNWNFSSKYGDLLLTSLTGITSTGNITVVKPYGDVS